MSHEYDADIERQKFAVNRSHKDAESSNASARSTAQAAILINGGAATAVLAFLAKGDLDSSIFQTASVCLAVYAIGVVAGAGMMYCAVRALDFYSAYWRLEVHPEPDRSARVNRQLGVKWWKRMRHCFWASMIAFAISSGSLATVLWVSKGGPHPNRPTSVPSALPSAPAASSPVAKPQ